MQFCVYWQIGGEYYPDKYWMDFGGKILGWWATAVSRMACGILREDLVFMDGPFALELLNCGNVDAVEFKAKNTSIRGVIGLNVLASEIFGCIQTTRAKLQESNVGAEDRENLAAA